MMALKADNRTDASQSALLSSCQKYSGEREGQRPSPVATRGTRGATNSPTPVIIRDSGILNHVWVV